ncbi:MAG: SURF1 family protein, partial [Caulobacteraceae bacterium]|nr:SURF1 family protein [Caulobacteraceae bacterium]
MFMRMRRFPWGLTLAVVAVFAALMTLGVWQVRRLAWKEALLARAAVRAAPARPIAAALAELARGGSVDFVRVAAACGPTRPSPPIVRYALDGDQVAWRAIAACPLAASPYDGVLVDRGLIDALTGAMSPRPLDSPPVRQVTGV